MKLLGYLFGLKILDLSSNLIERIQGIENIQIEELYLNHNKIEVIQSNELPGSLKILQLRGNLLSSINFLSKLQGLESLSLEQNKLETLSGFPRLPKLTELLLSNNLIFVLDLPQEIHELLPSLYLLDLSSNSLYDRLELLALNKISSLFELDLENNPCSLRPDFVEKVIKDYPKLKVINSIYIQKGSE